METAFLLVLLTLTGSGQLAVNFVNTDHMDSCEGKAILLNNILGKGGVNIIENKCVPSQLKFSAFSHKGPKDAPRHAYQVELGAEHALVKSIADMKACKTATTAKPDQGGVKTYCATSTQTPLG